MKPTFGSIRAEDFRFKRELPADQLLLMYRDFERECIDKQATTIARREYKSLPFIRAGWEWSVFRLDDWSVVKIPAGIFTEVADERYLENSREAYLQLGRFFPAAFIAKSQFRREDDLSIIEQEYIEGPWAIEVVYDEIDFQLKGRLVEFLSAAKQMVMELHWNPDFHLNPSPAGFKLRNTMLQISTGLPKLIDFTSLIDTYRIFPQMTERVVQHQIQRIDEVLARLK